MIKLDSDQSVQFNDKIMSEQETRQKILAQARRNGNEQEVLQLIEKFEKMMRNCANEKERRDMSKLGCAMIFRALGGGGELYVDNQLVVKE